jgi:hypothetical protein
MLTIVTTALLSAEAIIVLIANTVQNVTNAKIVLDADIYITSSIIF